MTSTASRRSISSPELADGPLQLDLLAGLMPAPSGPEAAPVSPSRSRAKAPELLMNGICGPTFTASSVPAGPLQSWESRLRERLAMIGSTESALIWREKVTPAGASISRLAPWTPPTSAAGSTGSPQMGTWPTPTSLSGGSATSNPPGNSRSMNKMLEHLYGPDRGMAAWSTPRASDGEKGGPNQSFGARGQPLPAQMHQSLWPTVTTMNGMDRKGMRPSRAATGRTGGYITEFIAELPEAALWPTPKASAAGETSRSGDRKDEPLMGGLMRGIAVSAWPTPTVNDAKNNGAPSQFERNSFALNVLQAGTALSGPIMNGSPATMAKRGAPNPAFPCWLMGYPAEWLLGAVSATQSIRSSRRK